MNSAEPDVRELFDLLFAALNSGEQERMDRFRSRLDEAHPFTKAVLEIWFPTLQATSEMARNRPIGNN